MQPATGAVKAELAPQRLIVLSGILLAGFGDRLADHLVLLGRNAIQALQWDDDLDLRTTWTCLGVLPISRDCHRVKVANASFSKARLPMLLRLTTRLGL